MRKNLSTLKGRRKKKSKLVITASKSRSERERGDQPRFQKAKLWSESDKEFRWRCHHHLSLCSPSLCLSITFIAPLELLLFLSALLPVYIYIYGVNAIPADYVCVSLSLIARRNHSRTPSPPPPICQMDFDGLASLVRTMTFPTTTTTH